jgi:hypothetical protein
MFADASLERRLVPVVDLYKISCATLGTGAYSSDKRA